MCIAAMEGGRNGGERRERGGTVKRRRLSDSPIGMDHLLRVRGVTNSGQGEYGIKPPPHPLRTSGRERVSPATSIFRVKPRVNSLRVLPSQVCARLREFAVTRAANASSSTQSRRIALVSVCTICRARGLARAE